MTFIKLKRKAVIRRIRITAFDGKKNLTKFYNLDYAENISERETPMKMQDWVKN